MAINNVNDQSLQTTKPQMAQNEHVTSAPEDAKPETKSGVLVNPIDPALASARFKKGDIVHKPVFANGTGSKGVYTIYNRRFNPKGRYIEYQLKDLYTYKVDGSWTREKVLKPGS